MKHYKEGKNHIFEFGEMSITRIKLNQPQYTELANYFTGQQVKKMNTGEAVTTKNETSIAAEIGVLNKAPIGRSIFLIEKIWFDSTENEVDSAVGYSPFGFVNTEDEAKRFCEEGRICTKKDCWAVLGELREYRYSEVKYCG